MTTKTIELIINGDLCTGCGTCSAVCQKNAIEILVNEKIGIYTPKINKSLCNNCGVCYEICPGNEIEYKQLNQEIFGKETENVFIGNYQNCYVGNSRDQEIRYNSASGGMITQILLFALEEGIINGALVVKMNENKPLEPEPFIARTKEEIIEASKSKYCPVPANIALKEILKSTENEKFAVVGLPCHINGIRKIENKNKKLKEKIVLHLGIFCNHSPNFIGTELYIKKMNIKKSDIINLDYRGEGWPGSMKIITQTHTTQTHTYKLDDYWNFIGSYFFYPKRCLLCGDGICELADISLGDAWLPEFRNDNKGKSIIISKSEYGEYILQKMDEKDDIELNLLCEEKIIQSQTLMLYLKKKLFTMKKKSFKLLNPCSSFLPSCRVDNLVAFFIYVNLRISSNSYLKQLLYFIPLKLIRVYSTIINRLITIKAKRAIENYIKNKEEAR